MFSHTRAKYILAILIIIAVGVAGVFAFRFLGVQQQVQNSKLSMSSELKDFPVFPDAKLKEIDVLEAEWSTAQPIPLVMQWYLQELPKQGWVITEAPDDKEATGEQVAQIAKGSLAGYIAVESESVEENTNEIVVKVQYGK